MPQIINTNITTLNSQRNTAMSQNSLAIAMQRLSSGMRVNSATQGLFDPDAGRYVPDGTIRLDYATDLVHSDDYNALKADLSEAVDTLFRLLDQRTGQQVASVCSGTRWTVATRSVAVVNSSARPSRSVRSPEMSTSPTSRDGVPRSAVYTARPTAVNRVEPTASVVTCSTSGTTTQRFQR